MSDDSYANTLLHRYLVGFTLDPLALKFAHTHSYQRQQLRRKMVLWQPWGSLLSSAGVAAGTKRGLIRAEEKAA